GPHDEQDQHDEHDPGHAFHDEEPDAAVLVADQHDDHTGGRHQRDLQEGHAGGRRGQVVGPPPGVAHQHVHGGQHHGHRRDDPAGRRAHGATLNISNDAAVEPDRP